MFKVSMKRESRENGCWETRLSYLLNIFQCLTASQTQRFIDASHFSVLSWRDMTDTFLFGKKIVLGIYCLCLTQLHLTALKWNWKSEDGFPVTLQGSVWGSWQVTLSVSPSLWRQGKKPSSPARCPWCSPLWLTTLVTTQVSHGLWGGLGLFPLAIKQLCSRLQLSSSSPVLLCHSS